MLSVEDVKGGQSYLPGMLLYIRLWQWQQLKPSAATHMLR